MYSVVLMMALSGSADVPAFGHKGGCYGGCSGSCYGGCSGSCYGSSCYGGCSGSSCHGCSGGGHFLGGRGGCHGCHGGGMLGHKSRGCHGCHGGCYGSCHGGYGGCYGSACYGGCTGSGCYGGCMGSGCYGGCMGSGCVGGAPVMAPAGAPTGAPPAKLPEKVPSPKKETSAPAPATIHVSLPAEAKLTIDEVVTKSTSSDRLFVSPNLQPGREYSYTLKAELVRDGKTVSVTRQAAVRAGEVTNVTIELPEASVAQK